MKGKITEIKKESIKLKDGTMKDKYTLAFEGDTKVYETWSIGNAKEGDEVEGETTSREFNGKTYYGIKLGGQKSSGGSKFVPKGPSIDAMLIAYAKDVAVAAINNGIIKTSQDIDATILHYHSLFCSLIK
jgi:hypothetical protein